MATIELVIKIPEELYRNKKGYRTNMDAHMICDAVTKGTPLPKGHGRLVDENDLVKDFDTFQNAFMIITAKDRFRVVCTAKTIVEADTEGAEK